MNGEFIVHLKTYDTARITQAFGENFGNKLTKAYIRSNYSKSGIAKQTDFCAGYYTNDSLFLVHNREGSALKVYVEPVNQYDLHNMKVIMNKYFGELVKLLSREKIKWSDPQAAILLENCPLYALKDLIKAFLSTVGAYIAQSGLIVGQILVSDNKKGFTFNF